MTFKKLNCILNSLNWNNLKSGIVGLFYLNFLKE